MFAINQIKEAHTKVKSGLGYSRYVQAVETTGLVFHYTYSSAEYKTNYTTSTFELISDANDPPSTVISTSSVKHLSYSLHQQHHFGLTLRTTTGKNRLAGLQRVTDTYVLKYPRQSCEHFGQKIILPETNTLYPEPVDSAQSHLFLEKLYSIIEDKLDDTSFSVEKLADQLAMSRVHLFRKLKTLTGLPASNLIRNYRLKRATRLLQRGLNSSETAYQVGFDSPQYFAKCFREYYHMTPTEFARKGMYTTLI